MKNTILIVDDEEQVIRALRRSLAEEGYEVFSAESGERALELIASQSFKVIVCDERMPRMSGAELLSLIRSRHPETVRILLTGHATPEAAMKAVNQGEIYRFFAKPWSDFDLKLAIRSAIEKYDLEMKNRKLLALVRHQARTLEHLESAYPGLTRTGQGADGTYFIPELSDEEVSQILRECQVAR